jgi:hypothetical protein
MTFEDWLSDNDLDPDDLTDDELEQLQEDYESMGNQ